MQQGGSLDKAHVTKPPWLRHEKRKVKLVRTIDGAERRRQRQLDELRRYAFSAAVRGDSL